MEADRLVQEVVETIRHDYEPEKIILFGSRARGDGDRESDLDILIVKESEKREIERVREVSRLLRRFCGRPYFLPLDILVKTPAEISRRLAMGDDFIRDIMQHGKVAYERAVV